MGASAASGGGSEPSVSELRCENEALREENRTYFNNCVLLARRLKELGNRPASDRLEPDAARLVDSLTSAQDKADGLLERLAECDEAARRCAQSLTECMTAACEAAVGRRSDVVRSRPYGRAEALRRGRQGGSKARRG